MRLGAVFPQTEIGSDPAVIRDFARALEDGGIDHLMAYDHVIGADIANRPDWPAHYYTHRSTFHEPLVLFSYLAGLTMRLGFVTGVMILPQRQTALVAKQAANLDVLSGGGRLRMGFGVGWNAVEYEALGQTFGERGARLDEQIDYLRRMWSEESFSFAGRFHRLTEAGINPLPLQRPIPIWIGGTSPAATKRAAMRGDGWLPVLPADQARDAVRAFRERAAAAGRDPERIGIETIVFAGGAVHGRVRSPGEVAADCEVWQEAGAGAAAIDTMNAGLRSPAEHLDYVGEVQNRLGLAISAPAAVDPY